MVTLVTGANGFLGAHFRAALEQRTRVVTTGRPDTEIPSAEFDSLLNSVRPEVVVHCAGPASVPKSIDEPAADFYGSVVVTFELLERLRRLPRPPRLVFVSSAAVYGEPSSLPVGEDDALRPISPYGHHKLVCEELLREFYSQYELPSVALRVFSAYGEGLRRQIIWDICVQAIVDGSVRLHGTGGESRDFIHVHDVATAAQMIVDRARFEAEAYNVASGTETTIAELASLVVAKLGVDSEISFSGVGRQGDPSRWRADIERIEAMGFSPSIALPDGVGRFAAWASRLLVHA